MNISRRTIILFAAVFAASQIAIASDYVLYHEIFTNSTDENKTLADVGWSSVAGAQADKTVGHIAYGTGGAYIEEGPVNSNDSDTPGRYGYVWVGQVSGGWNQPLLFWTDEYTIDTSAWDNISLSLITANSDTTSETMRMAIRIDDAGTDRWFVSEPPAWGLSKTGYWSLIDGVMTVDVASSKWRELIVDDGVKLEMGGVVAQLPVGNITAFGFFDEDQKNYLRVDNYRVEGDYIGSEPLTKTLTVTVDPDGVGAVDPAPGAYGTLPDVYRVVAADSEYCNDSGACYEFDHWVGDVVDSSRAKTSILMDDDKAVAAIYKLKGVAEARDYLIYQELFTNTSDNKYFNISTQEGWDCMGKDDATTYLGHIAGSSGGANYTETSINSNPSEPDDHNGYIFFGQVPSAWGQPFICWTDEYVIDRSQWGNLLFSVLTANTDTDTEPLRIAIRIDDSGTDKWFVSEPAAVGLGKEGYWSLTDGVLSAGLDVVSWRALDFTPWSVLAMGDTVEELPSGNITAFGIYDEEQQSYVRIDNYRVEADYIGSQATKEITIETSPAGLACIEPFADTYDAPAGVYKLVKTISECLDCPTSYVFDHWDGDVVDSASMETAVLTDSDKTITAVFTAVEPECGDRCHQYLMGDSNQDCHVNSSDLLEFASAWLSDTAPNND